MWLKNKEFKCECGKVLFEYDGVKINTPKQVDLVMLKQLYYKMFKVKAFGDVIEKSFNEGFTGNIQLNFFKGSITNINKLESIKV